MSKKSKISSADLGGLVNILTDATINVTHVVEDLNKQIVHPPFLPSTPIQHFITGVSGFFFTTLRGTTKLFGRGLAKGLHQLDSKIDRGISFKKKEDLVRVLNGVVGDYLSDQNNPLAISMQFRHGGQKLESDQKRITQAFEKTNGKVLLMVHGLCMDDTRWDQGDHNHGLQLAQELDFTPIYLYYNSGLPISTNGKNLNALLEKLSKSWPVPIEKIAIVAHSMGGLISRSAVHYGQQENQSWVKILQQMIFLGSPHHGAPLERVGNYIDRLFKIIPYVKPFARLGKLRSSGITDLRFGNIVEEDWQGFDRFENHGDQRVSSPLPKGIDCFAIAASIGKKENKLKAKIVGDGLVPIKSALGKHKDPLKNLGFKKKNTAVMYEMNHNDLLASKEVFDQMKDWLMPSK